jgi:hypothetical protein
MICLVFCKHFIQKLGHVTPFDSLEAYEGNIDVLFEVRSGEGAAEADACRLTERRLDDADQVQVLQRVRVPGTGR